jgi:gluconolactonase
MYVDINGKRVHLFDDKTECCDSMDFIEAVGFALSVKNINRGDGNSDIHLVVALESSIIEVNFTKKLIIRTISTVEDRSVDNMRFNDGKSSPDGKIICGYMHTKWREGNKGELYVLNNQSKLVPLVDSGEMHLPNGHAWHDNIYYFVDSGAAVVYRFHYEVDASGNAALKDKTVVYTFPSDMVEQGLMMDGMTIDQEGCLWIAIPGGGCIIRVDPSTKEEVFRLTLPTKKPTSLCFGGDDLEYLYVTSRNNGTEIEPLGKLYRCKIPWIKGLPRSETVIINHESEERDEPEDASQSQVEDASSTIASAALHELKDSESESSPNKKAKIN